MARWRSAIYPILLWVLIGLIDEASSKCISVSIADDERSIAYVCTDGATLSDLEDISSEAEWIEFSVSRIRYIPEGAFSRFRNLRRLSFYNCHIGLIEADAFSGLRRLEWLIFHGTKIHVVRASWFRHMPALRRLIFERCGLVHIEPETFRMTSRLEVLELNDNDLDCLPIEELGYLRSLKTVRVDKNPWLCECRQKLDEFFRERSIAQETYCERGVTLCAEYQCMTPIRIPVTALSGITHRVIVTAGEPIALSGNEFEASDLGSLNRLPDTSTAIEIHGMPIGTIPRYTFFRFGNSLRSLSIGNCRVSNIERDAFAGLHKLQRLSLTGNRFTILEPNWFRDLVGLKQLVLRGNDIHRIERTALWHLGHALRDLDLSNNRLRCLPMEELAELKTLERLNATGNPWSCACLRNLQRFLTDRNIGFEISSTCYETEAEIPDWLYRQPTPETSGRTTGRVHWISFEESVRDLNVTIHRRPPVPSVHVSRPPPVVYAGNCRREQTSSGATVAGGGEIYTCSGINSVEELSTVPRNAHTIRIVQSSIGVLPRNAFSRFNGYLSRLELRHCGIKRIMPGAFASLYSLDYLSLHSNQIDSITSETVEGLSRLRHLDLSRNRIDRITNDVFRALPYLTSLDISENSMNCIGVEYMSRNSRYLSSLRVAGNPWSCLCGTKLLDFLQKRGMRYDALPDAIEECYSTTAAISTLTPTPAPTTSRPELGERPVPTVEGSCSSERDASGRPRYRCVAGNSLLLASIPADAVAIEFYEGRLQNLPKGIFSRFSYLEELVIRNSDLLHIESGAFDNLNNLRNLTIQDNPLKSIAPATFSLKNLERLDLRGNSIDHIAPGAFRDLERLVYLNLEGNDLKCIFTSDLNDMPNVHVIEFAGNPLKWRCRVELEQFLETRKIKFVRVENSCEGKKLVRNLLLQNQTDLQSLDCSSDCSAGPRLVRARIDLVTLVAPLVLLSLRLIL